MKTLRGFLLVVVSGLAFASQAWAIDPMDAQSLQIRKYFINGSGSTLSSGAGVVLSYTDSGLSTGATKGATSNLGLHITTTTTASDRNFVGVVASDSCVNNAPCEVVTYGPALAQYVCSTTNSRTVNSQVGTSTVAGMLGSGTRAGLMLSPAVDGQATDGCLKWVFVNPSPGS